MRFLGGFAPFLVISAAAVAGYAPTLQAAFFYASASGSPGGDGSISKPWDLGTALNATTKVRPGDTVWLRGGRYTGSFNSYLSGSSSAPITIQSYPAELATLDGYGSSNSTLRTYGGWTIYRDFEVTNSDPIRTNASRPVGVYTLGPDQKFINLLIHDTGEGIATFPEASRVEVYGCIIFHNGYQGPIPDRGHGHGIYVQNATSGTKIISDNIIFENFGWGIHAYSEGKAGEGVLKDLYFEGNVSFNNGTLTRESYRYPNILVGGLIPASGITLTSNYTYHSASPADTQSANIKLGYVANSDVTITNNYLAGGNPVIDIFSWTSTVIGGNTLYGTSTMVNLIPPPLSTSYQWVSNQYLGLTSQSQSFINNSTALTFNQWQAAGLDRGTLNTAVRPTGITTFVRGNKYEAGRANIIIYNWALLYSTQLDVSQILTPGSPYAIRDAQNPLAPPLVSGIYQGTPITLPLSQQNTQLAVGVAHIPPTTAPEFRVFLLRAK